MAKKYELVVDYGKPIFDFYKTKKALKQGLLKWDKYYEVHGHELAYFDITVYENDKDVTEEIFKEFKLGFYKE